MKLKIVQAVVVLPGTVLVYVPSIIHWVSAGTPAAMEPGVSRMRRSGRAWYSRWPALKRRPGP